MIDDLAWHMFCRQAEHPHALIQWADPITRDFWTAEATAFLERIIDYLGERAA